MTLISDVNDNFGEEILAKNYSAYVEKAVEKYGMTWLDACVYIIEKYNIDPKVFAQRIPDYIKDKIRYECIDLKKIKEEKPNQLEFDE